MSKHTFKKMAVGLGAVLLLASCNVQIQPDSETDLTPMSGELKPVEADFSGEPASFGGTWSGSCAHLGGGVLNEDCLANVTIQQAISPDGKVFLWLTLDYKLGKWGNEGYGQVSLQPVEIKGNFLMSGTRAIGRIGSRALAMSEPTFASFSIRKFGKDQIGIRAKQVPISQESKPGSESGKKALCDKDVCFEAILTKKQDR